MNPTIEAKKKTKKSKTKLYLSYLIVALASSISAEAAVQVFTVPAGTVWNATNLFGTNKSFTISKVVITTASPGGATNLNYSLLDFPGFNAANGWGLIMKTNSGYMGIFQYLTNITKITTNFGSGDGAGNYVTTTNTFTNAVYTYTNYVGQISNAWRVLASGTVSSNSTATALEGNFPVIYGLGLTNNNVGKDLTVTVTYVPSL